MKFCLDCGTPCPASRCEEHEAERLAKVDLRRGGATQRGYDGKWKRLSEKARRRQPFCSECHHIGSPRNPLTVHHLRWPATSLEDCEVLCQVHNNRRGKTAALARSGSVGTTRPCVVLVHEDHAR